MPKVSITVIIKEGENQIEGGIHYHVNAKGEPTGNVRVEGFEGFPETFNASGQGGHKVVEDLLAGNIREFSQVLTGSD